MITLLKAIILIIRITLYINVKEFTEIVAKKHLIDVGRLMKVIILFI